MYGVSGRVCVISQRRDSAVCVIRRAALGLVSAWDLCRTDGAMGHAARGSCSLGSLHTNRSALLIAVIDQLQV